jgi:hypothetical protein
MGWYTPCQSARCMAKPMSAAAVQQQQQCSSSSSSSSAAALCLGRLAGAAGLLGSHGIVGECQQLTQQSESCDITYGKAGVRWPSC